MSRGEERRLCELVLAPLAARALRKLAKIDADRVDARIATLATDPRPVGVKKLAVRGESYRVRVGDYRILYTIDDDEHVVTVETIGHRRDVYRD